MCWGSCLTRNLRCWGVSVLANRMQVAADTIERRGQGYKRNAPRDYESYFRDLRVFYGDFQKDLQTLDQSLSGQLMDSAERQDLLQALFSREHMRSVLAIPLKSESRDEPVMMLVGSMRNAAFEKGHSAFLWNLSGWIRRALLVSEERSAA